MKNKLQLAAILFAVAFIFSCGENKTKTENVVVVKDTVKTAPPVVEKKYDRALNDMSRFIAGLAPDSGSAFTTICTKNANWKNYSTLNNKEWDNINTKRITQMNEWATKELKAQREEKSDVFYPFSGPDMLHAITFYPDAKNYYLLALEKCGSLPTINEMDSSATTNYLNSVNSSLQDVFNKSYFITKKMMNDLSKAKVNGALPLICVFLARTGNDVLETNYYHLKDDGSYEGTTVDSLKSFVKVDFRKHGTKQVQSVYYFRTNLENPSFDKNISLKAFLNKLEPCDTYLKSASYLLHYKTFSGIRDIILAKSNSVLEDDTGIPYSYFDDKWNVKIYGKYVQVTKDFKGVFQTDLSQRYQKDTTRTNLPFSLGYHWGDKNQNLIKAEKKVHLLKGDSTKQM
jgi:hypothetical protein